LLVSRLEAKRALADVIKECPVIDVRRHYGHFAKESRTCAL
jgi:hypothetical protein